MLNQKKKKAYQRPFQPLRKYKKQKMLFWTHIAFSFLIAQYSIELLKIKNQIAFTIIVLLSSIVPDIDESSSKISKNTLTRLIRILSPKHRGIWHTVYPIIAITILLFITKQGLGLLKLITIAFIIGYSSHLILDATTKKGVALLYPLSKKRVKGFIKVGGVTEKMLLAVLIIIIIYKLFHTTALN